MHRESVQDEVWVALLEAVNVDQHHDVNGLGAVGVLLDSFHVLLDAHGRRHIAVKHCTLEVLVSRAVT